MNKCGVFIKTLSVMAVLLAFPGFAAAADDPSRSIKVIVPYNVGAGVDAFARTVGEFSQKYWGQPLVVINKPGAGGEMGFNEGASAKPDGYTLTATVIPNTVYQPRARDAGVSGYKTEDFLEVGTLVVLPTAVFVSQNSPYKTWADVVKAAKEKPEGITAGVTGVKNTTHGFLLQLEKAAGVKFKPVIYTGGAPLMKDVIGGHVDLMIANAMFVVQARDTLRCLGVASPERFWFTPGVPTLAEQGTNVDDYLTRGIAVPKGTPAAIVDFLTKGMKAMSEDPEFRARMDKMGLPVTYLDAEKTQALVDDFIRNKSWVFEAF